MKNRHNVMLHSLSTKCGKLKKEKEAKRKKFTAITNFKIKLNTVNLFQDLTNNEHRTPNAEL